MALTKTDLNNIGKVVDEKIEKNSKSIRKDIKGAESTLRGEMKDMGSALRNEMGEMGTTLRGEMKGMGSTLRDEIVENNQVLLEAVEGVIIEKVANSEEGINKQITKLADNLQKTEDVLVKGIQKG